jgi:hypothetical protein
LIIAVLEASLLAPCAPASQATSCWSIGRQRPILDPTGRFHFAVPRSWTVSGAFSRCFAFFLLPVSPGRTSGIKLAPVRFGERALSYSPPRPLNDDEGLVDFLTGDPQV